MIPSDCKLSSHNFSPNRPPDPSLPLNPLDFPTLGSQYGNTHINKPTSNPCNQIRPPPPPPNCNNPHVAQRQGEAGDSIRTSIPPISENRVLVNLNLEDLLMTRKGGP
ncbi:hypothetical protein HanIR_Chr17g0849711 [Helianthus annuus]|nr:hypothetical protein HanIR_Chr17g0849711 [Helianthus annuus]